MIKALFPQLSSLVIEEIAEQGSILRIRARTPATAVACPECGEPAERVHAYHRRRLADLPAGGRGVVLDLRVRRLRCPTPACPRRTFREQVPTLIIDAVTHRRLDVLPDRQAATLAAWLREHPQVRVVCRDGSAAHAEAIRDGAPQAVQVSDRWHLWANLAKAVEKTVIAHSGCWHQGPTGPDRPLDERTRQRHAAVHSLLGHGVGLLECARRLGWALNTVKRYARAATAEQLHRPPRYRETLADPFRDHIRRRRAEDPQVPATGLLAEIRELGYTGSANLLVRYLLVDLLAAWRC